jgi:hypothetical protein
LLPCCIPRRGEQVDQEHTVRARAVARILAAVLYPLAWPGWVIERTARCWSPNWSFSAYTATPYFLAWLFVATLGIVSENYVWISGGLYIVLALEIIALWQCLTIAIGKAGSVRRLFSEFGRRSAQTPPGKVLLTSTGLYIGIASFWMTTYFFACLAFVLNWAVPNSYSGLKAEHAVHRLWELFYFSVITITTVGYGDVAPTGIIAQGLVVVEVGLGLFFVVFLFAMFTSFRVTVLTTGERKD